MKKLDSRLPNRVFFYLLSMPLFNRGEGGEEVGLLQSGGYEHTMESEKELWDKYLALRERSRDLRRHL